MCIRDSTGALSSKLGQLTELEELYVDRNANMTGGIPKEIGQLKKLARINISQSGIGGAIPGELGGCDALLQFMAFKTNLSGELPDIWDMPVLQTVMLHTNPGLTGNLPSSLSKLKSLANGTAPSMQLYGCNFTGNIPESFANLPEKTKQVYVQENQMDGVIPAAVQAHANFASWKYSPQQDGHALVLSDGSLDGRWDAPRNKDNPSDIAFVALFEGNKLDLYIIAWGQHYVGTYSYASGVIKYNISKAYQAYTGVTFDGEGHMTSYSWMAGDLDATTLALSDGYQWYDMDAESLASNKEVLQEFSFQLQAGNASATSSLFGIEDLVFTKKN